MNTWNHLRIAKIIANTLKTEYAVSIKKGWFMLGNVVPDFCANVVLKPHYIENYLEYVKHQIDTVKQSQKQGVEFTWRRSLRSGVICHYISDFFCFVHNRNFSGSSFAHVGYERRLNHFFKENSACKEKVKEFLEAMPADNTESLMHELKRLHIKFMTHNQNMQADMLYSLTACMKITTYLAKA